MKIQILKTSSSKGFKFLEGINRAIIPSQVTKLSNSISRMGIIRPVVVANIDFLGEKGMYILDGQHLFYALMRLDMDIPYVVIQVSDKKEMVEKIALLNASSKSWAMLDYITAWSCISEEYKKLMHYYNTYDFEICLTAGILMGGALNNIGGATINRIKSGAFKITNEEIKAKLLDCLTDVLKIVPRMGRIENMYLCKEYMKFYMEIGKAYDHKKFLVGLSKKKNQLMFVTQQPGKLAETFRNLI